MASGIKVLVVDDSAAVREALRGILEKEPAIAAVETASDGRIALRKVAKFLPDVVTMDVEMPGLDGLATLKEIIATAPRPVIMLSAFTFEGARKTIRALELGAVDFIQKPSGLASQGVRSIAPELVAKVVAFGGSRSKPWLAASPSPERGALPGRPAKLVPDAQSEETAEILVAVGASTGGTEAIRALVTSLPATFSAGMVVTQHMPEGFTLAFANRLNELCAVEVKEAAHRDLVRPGRVLIAPGHSHLLVRVEDGVAFVELSRRPQVNGHRPSADVMIGSAAQAFGSRCIGVLLTGMGKDGARGLLEVRQSGGLTFAEAEESCVVFGMPKAAIELGAASQVAALPEMSDLIQRHVMMQAAALRRR